jgi:hypothetical protein
MYGRRKPYTAAGIRRLPCIRWRVCGNMAQASWQICADNRIHRPVCRSCDDELNAMVLEWADFPDREYLMYKYKQRE